MRKTSFAQDALLDVSEAIEYRTVERKDLADAVRIYLESFPARVDRLFHNERHAAQFYLDLMGLMRLAHGRTFFAALHHDRLVGYLILTLPRQSLLAALFRERFILQVAAHALTGRYGFSLSMLGRVLRGLFSEGSSDVARRLSDSPHVYVVAVEKQFTGKGIGSALIEQARAACRGRFHRIWLNVERENTGAIQMYERTGFRIVESDALQHVMVWNLQAAEANAKPVSD
ncbi:MAG TPA: GNAT family N-acetyltransferase [Blastocatellia bacterium]|nr:GNAT family N-acetyltransferase [Blastocatellia bacterium]